MKKTRHYSVAEYTAMETETLLASDPTIWRYIDEEILQE